MFAIYNAYLQTDSFTKKKNTKQYATIWIQLLPSLQDINTLKSQYVSPTLYIINNFQALVTLVNIKKIVSHYILYSEPVYLHIILLHIPLLNCSQS